MKKSFVSEDILNMTFVAEPALSKDGRWAAYTAYSASEDGKAFSSSIYAGPVEAIQRVACSGNQKHPLFSPDGTALAYLSDQSGAWQVWLRDISSGECRQLTHARYGVGRFAWSPVGNEVAFEAAWWKEDSQLSRQFCQMDARETEAHRQQRDMAPRIIEEINYKRDETFGVFDGSDSYICAVDIGSGAHRVICGGDMPVTNMNYSPDGSELVFLGRPYKGPKNGWYEIFTCHADGSQLRQRTSGMACFRMNMASPCFADEKNVLYLGACQASEGGQTLTLCRLRLEDDSVENLLPTEDTGSFVSGWCLPTNRSVLSYYDTLYAPCGENIYFLSSRHGRELLCKISAVTGEITPIVQGDYCVSSFAVSDGGHILYRCGDPEHLADIRLQTPEKNVVLSQQNSWMAQRQIAKTHEHWVPSVDGKVSIQSWVTIPEKATSEKPVPVVLYIHGGPTCTSVHDFWHEIQALASSGMAVVTCNPRGSFGYGQSFANEDAAWGQENMDDLIRVLDHACQQYACIDGNRAGVTGGSYGGYMTLKLVSRTKRFRAAVGQRLLCNTATSYGTGDMGFYSMFQDPKKINMWEILSGRAKKSLITRVDDIDTPFLILHGYKDYRCGYEQAEQLFCALKDRRPELPVRLVMFPMGNHGVSRDGRPCDMVRHVQEMVDWFKKYLEVEGYE